MIYLDFQPRNFPFHLINELNFIPQLSLVVKSRAFNILDKKMSVVNVKWGKTKLENIEIDLAMDVLTLKSVLFSMTHVPVDKLKLMAKGKVLQDD